MRRVVASITLMPNFGRSPPPFLLFPFFLSFAEFIAPAGASSRREIALLETPRTVWVQGHCLISPSSPFPFPFSPPSGTPQDTVVEFVVEEERHRDGKGSRPFFPPFSSFLLLLFFSPATSRGARNWALNRATHRRIEWAALMSRTGVLFGLPSVFLPPFFFFPSFSFFSIRTGYSTPRDD